MVTVYNFGAGTVGSKAEKCILSPFSYPHSPRWGKIGTVTIFQTEPDRREGARKFVTVPIFPGNVLLTSECAEPCRIIRNRVGETIERIPFNPGSMIGSAFEDAIAGRLEVAKRRDKVPSRTQPVRNEAIDLNGGK
jgi:hypothetical protein